MRLVNSGKKSEADAQIVANGAKSAKKRKEPAE